MNKLTEKLAFWIFIALIGVGIYETYALGFIQSYWIFMVSVLFLLLYRYIKAKNESK